MPQPCKKPGGWCELLSGTGGRTAKAPGGRTESWLLSFARACPGLGAAGHCTLGKPTTAAALLPRSTACMQRALLPSRGQTDVYVSCGLACAPQLCSILRHAASHTLCCPSEPVCPSMCPGLTWPRGTELSRRRGGSGSGRSSHIVGRGSDWVLLNALCARNTCARVHGSSMQARRWPLTSGLSTATLRAEATVT